MFFCKPCEDYNNWPNSIFKSFGKCEMCNKQAECNDVPSKYLPPSRAYREREAKKIAELQMYKPKDVPIDIFDALEVDLPT